MKVRAHASTPNPEVSMRRDRIRASIGLLAGLALMAAWSVFMFGEWRRNPDLSHGLLTPVLYLLLVHEARARGTPRYLPSSWQVSLWAAFFLLGSMVMVTVAGLIAAALAWSNALVSFLLGGTLSFVLLGGLVVGAQNSLRWIPLNWPALVSCLLWLLSAPIPPGTYSRLTLALQLGVTRAVITSLHVLGIPAQQVGNVIQLSSSRIGVEDACSGIRSLVSCIVAALFLSATLVRSPWARLWLIVLAAPLAIVMNFLRSLALTLAADRGYSLSGTLHDLSGFVVLAITAGLLAAIALVMGRHSLALPAVHPPREIHEAPPRGLTLFAAATLATLLLITGFVGATRPAPLAATEPPDLQRVLPSQMAGWRVDTTTDLYQFSSTLKTSHLVQRSYYKDTERGPLQITVYLAYWLPGQAPVSLVSSHTPDACWPGSGWIARPEASTELTLTRPSALPAAQYREFRQAERVQYVWFWHLYRGELVTDVDPFSPAQMIRVVLRYGIRSEAEQVFVRISSNQPWEHFDHEPLTEEIIRQLHPLGL